MRRAILVVLLVLLLASFAYAGAQWYPTTPKYEMKQRMYTNYCPVASQCLVGVGSEFNSSLDGRPEFYFSSTKPRCINNTQYILDYYCENGAWATRTKLIALTLINFANRVSPGNFVVYCDKYDKVLNQVDYSVSSGRIGAFFSDYRCFNQSAPCINHLCVLDYQGKTAIGASFNTAVNDPSNSLLLAMNVSASVCNGVSSAANDFVRCGTSDFFYNPLIKSIVYLPLDTLQPGANFASVQLSYVKPHFDAINNYAASITAANFSFFGIQPFLNRFYYAERSGKKIFAFEEVDKTDMRHSYLGVRYIGYGLGANACSEIFQQYSESGLSIYCKQPSVNEFIVVSKKTPGQAGITAWQDLSSKLRLR